MGNEWPFRIPQHPNSILVNGEGFEMIPVYWEPVDQLLFHPDNFYVHTWQQQNAMIAAFKKLGWIYPILVNRTTGHVIDGHMRAQVAADQGQTHVPVIYTYLTPEEEQAALLSLNSIGKMAIVERGKFRETIRQFASSHKSLAAFINKLISLRAIKSTDALTKEL